MSMNYKQPLSEVVQHWKFECPPRELTGGYVWSARPAATKTTIHAVATRIRQVADYFQANPKMRVKGTLKNGHKVCAIGAVKYSRKIGLTWDPVASRNCNSSQTMNVMDSMGIVDVNDSAVPTEQFLSYMRYCADVLDAWADTGNWAESVNKQPLAKRLKIDVSV